ncbi:LLM class flavin-dependent oxidoreductase [Umezawaea sp. Da 62-37]|uniref:LLM class flavin-dependent oxidoreductase n=1 Tax=Umezawaea sp. Da 62-37 TaxID=3075927 RepID=UPI0028F747B6|nr:LLM class flavin-dependent oxidoreductase [Umezawaea sp. Da 62-37]WNV85657.1 LLM class flavin-dependent oxidoreductase [Umezawaea sp. Da 62-37]
MTVDIGIASLTDLRPRTVDGRDRTAEERISQITALAELADREGLDHVGIGEHHNPEFVVSSPAVVLAAVAARTTRVRLTSSVSTLSALDPVRLHEDFATLDLISSGRAELTVGRSAYPEPFALFGYDIDDYEALFEEKLDLLLRLRATERVTWRGRFRSPLADAAVVPRPVQPVLPVWLGVGGTPTSAARAGLLGLPMILGYIGGGVDHLARLADVYREAGDRAGYGDRLRLGVAVHYFGAATTREALETYPHYHDFLRPKRPGGGGFTVGPEQFRAGLEPGRHLMIGTSEHVAGKLVDLVDRLRVDRVQALVDWGGLPERQVEESVTRLAREIAPLVRAHVARGGQRSSTAT